MKKKVYVLFDRFSQELGHPMAVFPTKKALKEYVRDEYPFARGEQRGDPSELYGQWDYQPSQGADWLRGEEVNFISAKITNNKN